MAEVAIEAVGLRKRFGEVVALDGVDLSVEGGSIFGLLGPNGAGKTTAVRILTTILEPDGGRAAVLGRDVVTDGEAVRNIIGLAGQYAAVDENLTGRENLLLVGRLTHLSKALLRERSDQLLDRFDLVDAANRPVKTYSGGMRRRIDLAASLVHHPPVLFLDEPTSGLDPLSRTQMWGVIEELVAEGTTVLLTTQYLEEADRLASQIAVVDRGHVIASGSPAELKASLGATVIDIGFTDDDIATRAAGVLAPLVPKPPVREGSQVEVTVDDGPRLLLEGLRMLDQQGLAPATVALREPSLDDVFLALTGERTKSDADANDAAAADGRNKVRGAA